MLISSANRYESNQRESVDVKNNKDSQQKIRKIRSNGQIHIYQSAYRGSYSTIIRDSLRNAALGRKVLLIQLMKGGVDQGIKNPIQLCGNLVWIRPSNSYDQYLPGEIDNDLSENVKESIITVWQYCKDQLLSGEQDQIILDEIFRAVELGIIEEDDLISTLHNRFIAGDVILTGTAISKQCLLIADQVTELRS